MEQKVNNIKELAGKVGLSATTVSRVLNGKSENLRISKATSKKVLDAARKYHYSPNRIARGLKLEKTETIGLIIPDIANPYFGSIAKTIEVEAHNSGYSIILCDSLDDEHTEAELLHLLAGRKVDGIIIAPTLKDAGLNVPNDVSIVSFDEQPYSAFLACPMTTVEQPREEIGKLAFQYLLSRINDGNEGKT